MLVLWPWSWRSTRGGLSAKFDALLPHLDERQRRLVLGAEARWLGHGGIELVARASGTSRKTVAAGVAELEAGGDPLAGRIRRPGGGRKPLTDADPGLLAALDALVEPASRGDPMCRLRWTVKSTRNLAGELRGQGHAVSHHSVARLLSAELDYSLQGNAKTLDTAQFAVATIRSWWAGAGRPAYPGATKLLISADAGGSNGYRLRLWKTELARLADETGLAITVCHMPPGTSKWNKIEHRLFSHITMNWAGQPLTSHDVAVRLIAGTTTRTGLTVHAERDTAAYPRGIKISDREMRNLERTHLTRHDWHGEWNYTISPATA